MQLSYSVQTPPVTFGAETIIKERWLSRVLRTIVFLVMTLGAVGGGIAIIYLWFNSSALQGLGRVGALFGVLCCLTFGLIGYTFLGAGLQRSNWLLRVGPQALVIKFRSDMNARLPEPHPVIVSLAYRKIAWARKTREWVQTYSLNSSSGPNKSRVYFLDIGLQLDKPEFEQLQQAIDTEIRYKPGAGKSALFHHYPVRLDGKVLRIQWWGALRPKLDATLSLLQPYVQIEQELDLSVDFRQAISPTDAKQKVLDWLVAENC